tara:strand:+ start:258 stop:986 length:729 start_codon:yes stop_codon:yes gene_type:complete
MDKKEIKNKPDKTIPYIKRDFEDDADDKEYKNAAWETWLEKNNGIETDHKNDKKEEWDGKFDNATTRDDVKDDEDDKAISEEESLEELTDGKLEEVEKLKSWESWLNKYEETVEDKRLAVKLDESRAVLSGKVSKPKIKPDAGVDAKMGEFSNIQAEKLRSATVSPLDSWATWLEKQQGAGDARFGNQHLTGLDQEPVDNKEDEANILPAKDVNSKENDEKQEETEDKEGKDNKPYKALSQE